MELLDVGALWRLLFLESLEFLECRLSRSVLGADGSGQECGGWLERGLGCGWLAWKGRGREKVGGHRDCGCVPDGPQAWSLRSGDVGCGGVLGRAGSLLWVEQ